eukprot:GGOE01008489.1.p3 GENE.GGOE01008489.1~~GGOE01008489.1.p3  ORF type:complete len:115 (-),score=8.72 GGOE01008489.1:1055-1399(-)
MSHVVLPPLHWQEQARLTSWVASKMACQRVPCLTSRLVAPLDELAGCQSAKDRPFVEQKTTGHENKRIENYCQLQQWQLLAIDVASAALFPFPTTNSGVAGENQRSAVTPALGS